MSFRSMFAQPEAPVFSSAEAVDSEGRVRYEDTAQDGRATVLGLVPSISWGVWRQLLASERLHRETLRQGLIPILSRMVAVGTEAAFRLDEPVRAVGGYQLARSGQGDDTRLYINMWTSVLGRAGSMFPPRPAGDWVEIGRVFAEHTWTRPFAPPGQRRVTEVNLPGIDASTFAAYTSPVPTVAGMRPDGAREVAPIAPDPAPTVFGLDHTDSNQHVNSLVYPRLFIDAALRRLASAGHPTKRLVREFEVAYRKPSFAGDQVRIHVGAFDHDGTVGAHGHFAADNDTSPRCYLRARF